MSAGFTKTRLAHAATLRVTHMSKSEISIVVFLLALGCTHDDGARDASCPTPESRDATSTMDGSATADAGDPADAALDATIATRDAALDGGGLDTGSDASAPIDPTLASSAALLAEGRNTFRFETFGDEAFWGGSLGLHRAVAGAAHGGVGPGLSPMGALGLGLKVDADAIPAALVGPLMRGEVDLNDPASTLALLRGGAVIGVTGFFATDGSITSLGIQCALCHSTVDDSFAPGIGHRLDGWPNRDLDVGQIIALAPDLTPLTTLLMVDDATVRTVLRSWGPGRFDAELILDGRATRPGGGNASTLMPAAFGMNGVDLHTYTGWGSVTYWNAFVATLEMHGQGRFFDPRLDDATRFPVAARARLGHVVPSGVDRVTPRLAALDYYQRSLPIPTPPAGSFDAAAAARGDALFSGRARCTECHVEPLLTEPGWNMHMAAELGIDDFQASRSPDDRYRTTPLRGLFTRMRGGFYHDGRFATLADVVTHYDTLLSLGLTAAERADLVQYLMSL
jgi:hypothetical protein